MFTPWRTLWRKRLWPAILLPTLLAMGVLTSLVFFNSVYLTTRHDREHTVQAMDMALNLLGYAAESFAFRGSLQRLVSFIGTEEAIDTLVIAAGEPRTVIASTRLEEVGHPLEQIYDQRLALHMAAKVADRRVPEMSEPIRNGSQTIVRQVMLRLADTDGPGHERAEIGVTLNASALGRLSNSMVTTFAVATVLSLFAALLTLAWVVRRRIVQPLEAIIRTMARREKGQPAQRVTVPYPDEFARVAARINDAFDSIDTQQAELRQLALIAQVTSNLVVITRANREIEWVNDAFERALGFTLAESRGRRLQDFVRGRSTDRQLLERFWDTIGEGKAIGGEVVLYGRDGREIETEFVGRPLRDEEGRVSHCVIIANDLTETRYMQRQVNAIAADLREEVAYTLHDTIGGDLGGLSFRAKLLTEQLSAAGRPEAAQAAELTRALGDISNRTRALSQLMAPTSAVLGGLTPALERLCDSLNRAYPLLRCELRAPGSIVGLADWEATQVYLIAQEALRNATRHGSPTRIRVSLVTFQHRLRLQVTSDGSAWDPDGVAVGVGLRAMRYRASLMNAEFSVRVRPSDAITSVRCMIPLRPKPAPLQEARSIEDSASWPALNVDSG